MPLRFIGLQRVMTAHAALFLRYGRIDCSECQFSADVEQLGYRFWVWYRCEGSNGLCHSAVRRRRRDFPSRHADRAKAKLGIVAVPLVEGFDRMSPKGRGNRCALSKLRSDGRVVGDEGVDQLERNDLFAALVILEPVQAEVIESITDRDRQYCADAHVQEKAAPRSRSQEAPDSRNLTHPSTLGCLGILR